MPPCPALSTQSACPHPCWVLMKLCSKETLVVCKMVAYHIQVVEICHQRNCGSDNLALVWSFQIFSVHGITLSHCGLVMYMVLNILVNIGSWLCPLDNSLADSTLCRQHLYYLEWQRHFLFTWANVDNSPWYHRVFVPRSQLGEMANIVADENLVIPRAGALFSRIFNQFA